MVLCCTFMNACPIKPTGSLPYGFYLKQIFNTTRKAENSQKFPFGKRKLVKYLILELHIVRFGVKITQVSFFLVAFQICIEIVFDYQIEID